MKNYKKLLSELKVLFLSADNAVDDDEKRKVALDYWTIGKKVSISAKEEEITLVQIAQDLKISPSTIQKHVRIYNLYKKGLPLGYFGKVLVWSHFVAVMYINNKAIREFYLKETCKQGWSSHELRRRVRNKFYENLLGDTDSKRSYKLVSKDQRLYTYSAKVLNVIDGDTMRVEVDVGFSMRYETKLRLRGIDCAERGTKKGDEAKAFVENEILGSGTVAKVKDQESAVKINHIPVIVIRTYKTGKFGRFIADVWYLKGEKDSEAILEKGHLLNQVLLDKDLAVKM